MKVNTSKRTTLNDLLSEDGTLEELNAIVTKERLVWLLEKEMKKKRMTKLNMANAVGKTLKVELV